MRYAMREEGNPDQTIAGLLCGMGENMCSRYLVPDRARLDESLRFAEKYDSAFEYDDFCLPDVMDDREEMKKRIRRYREIARDRSRDTLHGAFYDVNVAK